MSSDYTKVEKIIEKADQENKKIIAKFTSYLESQNLAKKTIKRHEGNISFFAEFLNYYTDNENDVKTLLLAEDVDLTSFSMDFFPSKAMWASEENAKQNTSTLKKFYTWAYSENLVKKDLYNSIITIIREEKSFWYEAADC